MAKLQKKLYKYTAFENCLYYYHKYSCKRREIKNKLTKEQFITLSKGKCFYCNKSPSTKFNNKRPNGKKRYKGWYKVNGIDRLDNDKGYTVDNCVPCCPLHNFIKGDAKFKDFELIYLSWKKAIDQKIDKK